MMNARMVAQKKPSPVASPAARRGVLQRRCACGGTPGPTGECSACRQGKQVIQRHSDPGTHATIVPPAVNRVLRSPGQPLDETTRAFMDSRFGYSFDRVRVHTDSQAVESAKMLNAQAYTVGYHIVFSSGAYSPTTASGVRLLAHELAHVVQQDQGYKIATRPESQIVPLSNSAYRIAVAPVVEDESGDLERRATMAADEITQTDTSILSQVGLSKTATPLTIQRYRIGVPRSPQLCGCSLTHVDIEPPRSRPLEPCLPPSIRVNRLNIVGREVTTRTRGRGRQVFNLHVGYYRDSETGRLCGVVDDSKKCVSPRCVMLGCFPTLREVIDAILDFLKIALLVIVGVIVLAVILGIILEGLPALAPALIGIAITEDKGTKVEEGGAEA